MARNLVGGVLLRRLLTDLRGSDLFGRYRYPLRVEYVPQISQMYTDFSGEGFLTQISLMTQIFYLIKICGNLCNLWDKKHHEEKSVEYVGYYLQEIFSSRSSISLGIP